MSSVEHGTAKKYGGKEISNKCFQLFYERCFRRFYFNVKLILDCWRSYRESTLPIYWLVLGTKSCLEMNDLRVLEISEKCRSNKHVVVE